MFAHDKEKPVDQVEIRFLRYKCSGEWEYPIKEDIKIVDAKYVFFGPEFAEDSEALKLFKIIQKKNT